MRKIRKELIMFIFFMGVLVLLIYRLVSDKAINYRKSIPKKVIENKFNEPKDYAKEKWLNERHKQYYDYLYDKKE